MATNNPGLTTSDDLLAFHQFVSEKLKHGCQCSPEELLDEWRLEHPTAEEIAANVSALRIAIAEADSGQGRPVEDVIAEIRSKLNLPLSAPEG